MAHGETWRRWYEANRERVRDRQRERAAKRRLKRELAGEPPRAMGRPGTWAVFGMVNETDSLVSRVWAGQDGAAEEPGQRVLLGGSIRLWGSVARRLAKALSQTLGVPLGPPRPRQSARPGPGEG